MGFDFVKDLGLSSLKKAQELGSAAVTKTSEFGGSVVSTVSEKLDRGIDVGLVTDEIMKAVAETKPEFLRDRVKAILEANS